MAKKGGEVLDFTGLAVKATEFQDASGNVIGTATTSTDKAITRFSGTAGAIQNSATTIADTTGAITFTNVGGTINLKRGSNAKCGTVVLTAGAGTVTNTSIAITDSVILSLNTVGGTIAGQPYVATITAATGFTVAGGGGSNTSTYNYAIISNLA